MNINEYCSDENRTIIIKSVVLNNHSIKLQAEKKLLCDKQGDNCQKDDIKRLLTIIIECSTILPFRWHCNKYLCLYCCCSFVDSSQLKKHAAEEHEEVKLRNVLKNVKKDSRFKLDLSNATCKICSEPFQSLEDFLSHVSGVHCVKFNEDVRDCFFSFKLTDDTISCLGCGLKFSFFGPLLAHFHKNHVASRTFLCEICGEGFVRKLNLDSHVKGVHSFANNINFKSKLNNRSMCKVEKYKCSKCPQVFRSKYLKRQHFVLEHDLKNSQFACDSCPKIFLLKSRLIQHKRRVHLKEKFFSCEVCGFKAFCKSLILTHMVKHSDSRPFHCDICKKTFQRKKNLETHRRIHTNDRRYVCKDCGKAFVQVTSLKLHMRVHHSVAN